MPKRLRAVLPNAGLEAEYRRRLLALVDDMARSLQWWLRAVWRSDPPELAEDELPVDAIRRRMRELSQRWQRNFDEAAPKLAAYFAQQADQRSTAALRKILRDGGFLVKFRPGPAAKDVMGATVAQNVALIKSIAAEELADVEGLVMRSVQAGRDLGYLVEQLQHRHGVTRRRAELIASTQNNMATAAFFRVRCQEVGIERARWRHSGGGKTPRPTHVAMSGKEYPIAEGMWDEEVGYHVHPGELINCRCVAAPVVSGFS